MILHIDFFYLFFQVSKISCSNFCSGLRTAVNLIMKIDSQLTGLSVFFVPLYKLFHVSDAIDCKNNSKKLEWEAKFQC